MSVENLPPSFSESLDQLEVMFTDPFVERTLKIARTYNDIFKETDPTHEEKDQTVIELDSEWGTINKEPLNITGPVRVRTQEDEEPKVYFLDDQMVTSNGFTVIDEPMYMDGEIIKQNSRVVYHMYVPAEAIGIEEEDGVVFGGTAEIDGTYIDFNKASMERAVPWLTYNKPELLEEVDGRLFSVDGSEADAVLALRGLKLPDDFEDESELTKNSFVHYLNEVVELDSLLPYEIGIKGDLYAAQPGSMEFRKVRAKIRKALVYVSAIAYLHDDTIASDNKLRLVLNGLLLGAEKSDDNATVRVPIDSLSTLKSIRPRYYEQD
ncbi:MAG: hypothetical protein JWN12_183 [Candidatus Saccharibacteria bacterium]|nr:hypothetical protein [Candidatus Saccharibacteria bacterium]